MAERTVELNLDARITAEMLAAVDAAQTCAEQRGLYAVSDRIASLSYQDALWVETNAPVAARIASHELGGVPLWIIAVSGYGYGDGYGYGCGDGSGYGDGDGSGSGYGDGSGYGYGYGYGYGDGYGDGYGSGSGDGDGDGFSDGYGAP